jgi:hypothetical protein
MRGLVDGSVTGMGGQTCGRWWRAGFAAAAVAVSVAPAAADDFGFDQLAKVIVSATSGAPAMVPFIERPVLSEAELAGPPSAFGYLGSVTNPRIAYDRRGKTSFYRTETDNKCNPDNFAFPPGQAGLQKIAYGSFFKFEVKAGELTIKGASPGEKLFTLSPFEARILRRITVTISDLKEYTLDFRLLKRRVAQVAAEPECAEFKHALTKVFEGKVSVTYYFEAGADVSAQFDIANTINLKLGLSVISQTGQSEEKPNELSFDSAPRIFAARFRPIGEILGTPRRIAGR